MHVKQAAFIRVRVREYSTRASRYDVLMQQLIDKFVGHNRKIGCADVVTFRQSNWISCADIVTYRQSNWIGCAHIVTFRQSNWIGCAHIVTFRQIGRASCRERVLVAV